MATLLDLKDRIKTVTNIKKVTRAMQLVAAAKFNRAQLRAKDSRPYTRELSNILGVLSALSEGMPEDAKAARSVEIAFDPDSEPLWTSWQRLTEPGEGQKPGLVLITSDRGLCGAFNTRLIRAAQEFLARHKDKSCQLITIGRKGRTFFKSKNYPILYSREGLSDRLVLGEIREVTQNLVRLFTEDEVDSLHLIYTRFKSAMSSTVAEEQFLSIPPVEAADTTGTDLYIMEPDRMAVFNRLFPLYATTRIFSALAESFASEYGARMTAMQLATNNAEEMLNALIIQRNRLRQAIITKELAEIVGGAEALK